MLNLDEMEAQLDSTAPYYLPGLIRELRKEREARATAEAERDALREQVQALTEWRPMATAPKDGTDGLLCDSCDSRDLVDHGYLRRETWEWLDGEELQNPIGWLPLPAPPTEDR